MRIGLLSDSHGQLEALQRAFLAMGEVDLILHAGDLYQDALWLMKETDVQVLGVAGNCDVWSLAPRDRLIAVCGHQLWLVHGHRLGIKQGYEQLMAAARSRGADIVVFGHTHHPVVFRHDNILCVNPGSVSDGRGCEPSYGILEVDGGGVRANTFPVVD